MKCQNCGHDPDEPVYVGPGDKVGLKRGSCVYTVLASPRSCRITVYDASEDVTGTYGINDLSTLDGRPVAGYRDPRDERIKELEARATEQGYSVCELSQARSVMRERIAELESELFAVKNCNGNACAELAVKRNELRAANERIKELEAKSPNPLVGLTDEQLKSVKKTFMDWAGYNCHTHFENACLRLLRDIRDNKLEVPK